jgi:hypothetical protein
MADRFLGNSYDDKDANFTEVTAAKVVYFFRKILSFSCVRRVSLSVINPSLMHIIAFLFRMFLLGKAQKISYG